MENNFLIRSDIKDALMEEISLLGSAIIDYNNDHINIIGFYNKERLLDYLDSGINCIAYRGVFPIFKIDSSLFSDNGLFILKNNGEEYARYEFIPILKSTIKYKDKDKIPRSKVYTLRRCAYTDLFSYKDMEQSELFNDFDQLNSFFKERFGKCFIIYI